MKHYIHFIFLLIFFHAASLPAQEVSRLMVPAGQNGEALLNPFAGGLTAPQFSEADLNFDGVLDLVAFDRTGDVVMPFIYKDEEYRFAPEYISAFPNPRQWMLMRDYNGDGIEDIFMAPTANGIAGVEVHTGKNVNGELSFELASITDDGFNVIYIPLGNIETQVYNSLADIPGIADLDGDGDLEIVAFEPGGSTVTLYKNTSVENTGEPGLEYIISDDCFGKLVESGFSENISLSPDGIQCGNFLKPAAETRHAGSTVALYDINVDGMMDAVIGDISNDGLVLLTNGGDEGDIWFTEQDTDFPSNDVPVRINIFNTAFFIDVDHDNEKDMLVSPNELSGLQTKNHLWYYNAIPSTAGPTFELEEQNFLVDEMLYFGKDAAPTFIDYNLDGLIDILVGSAGKTDIDINRIPTLTLIKNVGTITEPAFEIFDEDYLGFSRFNTTSSHFFPTTGDLDSDGDVDLLVGDDRGFFYYVENIAGDAAVAEFAEPIYRYQDLNPGQFVKPSLYDFNKDGLLDIVVGERNFNTASNTQGSLNFYANFGTPGDPQFAANDESYNSIFGEVFTKDQGFIRNLSAPHAFVSEDRTLLMVGTESGNLRLYDDIDDNLNGSFTELSVKYGDIKEGNHSYPALFDLDNDGFYELLIGNRRGGLGLYSTSIVSEIRSSSNNITIVKEFTVSPNPVSDFMRIQGAELDIQRVELMNLKGQIVLQNKFSRQLNIKGITSGTYFLKIYADKHTEVHKVIISH